MNVTKLIIFEINVTECRNTSIDRYHNPDDQQICCFIQSHDTAVNTSNIALMDGRRRAVKIYQWVDGVLLWFYKYCTTYEVSFGLNAYIALFWIITPYNLVGLYQLWIKCAGSIFRVQGKLETVYSY
jgi:hypothetical protein